MSPGRKAVYGVLDQLRSRAAAGFQTRPLLHQFPTLRDEKIFGKAARQFGQLISLNSISPRRITLNQAQQMRALSENISAEMSRLSFHGETQKRVLDEIGQLRGSGIMLCLRKGYYFEPQIRTAIHTTIQTLGEINDRIDRAARERKAAVIKASDRINI